MSKNKKTNDIIILLDVINCLLIVPLRELIIEMSPILIFFFFLLFLIDRTSLNPDMTQLVIYTLSLATILYLIHLKIKGVRTLKTEMLSCSSAIMLSIFILTFVYPSLQKPWSLVEDVITESVMHIIVIYSIGLAWILSPFLLMGVFMNFCDGYKISTKLKFILLLFNFLVIFSLYLLYFDSVISIVEEYISDIARTVFYILFGGLSYIYFTFLFLSKSSQ